MSLFNLSLAAPSETRGLVRLRNRIAFYLVAILPIVLYVSLACSGYKPSTISPTLTIVITALQLPIVFIQVGLCLLCLSGVLIFGAPKDRRPGANWRWDPKVKLIVAYVSRGNQPATLKQSSSVTQALLEELGVNYTIEVVTDVEIPFENRLNLLDGEVLYYVVPSGYQTDRGARYKARALQYLLEQRIERLDGREDEDNVWILHLDEESIITPECMVGIRDHIHKYDLRRTTGAIGQGEIMYNSRHYGDNLLITGIDAVRTGHDLGLFRLAFKTHLPLIGMHGSYVLTPASIEREITWDVGGTGSVTEDAYFALAAMQRGVTFDWVEGFIREQSPFTIRDLIRQRRRWFCGLRLVAFDPELKFRTTCFLRLTVMVWAIGSLAVPLPFFYLAEKLIYGTCILPFWAFVPCAICWGMYASQYCLGAYRNLRHCEMPLARKVWLAASSLAVWFLNIPTLAESAGTLQGLFFPVNTFYVVAKDTEAPAVMLESVPANS